MIGYKNRLAGMVIVAFLALCAAGGFLLPVDAPYAIDAAQRLLPPSQAHWFGTDTLGRDLFARVIGGAAVSLSIGLCTGLVSACLGLAAGLAAVTGPLPDRLIMYLCDGLKAIPSLLLAIALLCAAGAGTENVVIALVFVNAPSMARLARASALAVKGKPFIENARALGAPGLSILFRHILPNIANPVLTQTCYVCAQAIIAEASLSYLGAGVPAPVPSWGSILAEGQTVIFSAWWMIAFPGVFTALAVLGFNLLADTNRIA